MGVLRSRGLKDGGESTWIGPMQWSGGPEGSSILAKGQVMRQEAGDRATV